MPMIVSNKQRIYFTVEGERGSFLLLHHGLFGSQRDWYEWGFVKALSRDYRLVIPDARGHGRSDKSLDSDQYRLKQMGDDVIEILDRLEVRTINFIGYSLGAIVGFDVLSRYPARVRGAVLGGEAPTVSAAALGEWRELATRLESEELSLVVNKLREENRLACSNTQFSDDPINQSAPVMLKAMGDWPPNEAEQIQLQNPLALFAGKHDPAGERLAQTAGRIASCKMISLEAETSAHAMAQPEALLKEIVAFLDSNRNRQEQAGASDSRGSGEGSRQRAGRRSRSQSRGQSRGPTHQAPDAGKEAAQPESAQSDHGETSDQTEEPPGESADVSNAVTSAATNAGSGAEEQGEEQGEDRQDSDQGETRDSHSNDGPESGISGNSGESQADSESEDGPADATDGSESGENRKEENDRSEE